MCGHFITLLNDVIEGNSINDEIQLAEFVSNEHMNKILADAKEVLKADSKLHNEYRRMFEAQAKLEPLFFKLFPPENDDNPKTLSISKDFSETITQQFFSKAKSEGITVHSAFCSIFHAAFVELLNASDSCQEEYELLSAHDMNYRRYWNIDGENSFGVHIGIHKTSVVAKKNFMGEFWQNAKKFHDKLHAEIKKKHAIMMGVIEDELKPGVITEESFYSNKTPAKTYYSVSNMGEITRLFKRPDGGDHSSVQAVHLRRSTSLHTYELASAYSFQTLNGMLLCGFDYNTRYVSTKTAHTLLDKTIEIMNRLFE